MSSQPIKTQAHAFKALMALMAFSFPPKSGGAVSSASCASSFHSAEAESEIDGMEEYLLADYINYSGAKKAVEGLNFQTASEYLAFVKNNPDLGLPSDPWRQYPDEWEGWSAFLGITKKEKAHSEALKLALSKALDEIEAFPDDLIEEALNESADILFLSDAGDHKSSSFEEPLQKRKRRRASQSQRREAPPQRKRARRPRSRKAYPSYTRFKEIVQKHGVMTTKEWIQRRKELMAAEGWKLPATPASFYEREWEGWGVITGSGRSHISAGQAPSYEEFKKILRKHHVGSFRHYLQSRKALMEATGLKLPGHPHEFYGQLWEGWGVITGSGRSYIRGSKAVSYKKFKEIVKEHNIISAGHYRQNRQALMEETGLSLPGHPNKLYGEEWEGWDAVTGFRGSQRSKRFPSYKKFKAIIRFFNIKTSIEYLNRRSAIEERLNRALKSHAAGGGRAHKLTLPAHPMKLYQEKWEGWGVITGSGRIRIAASQAPSYEEFIEILRKYHVKSLKHYLQSRKELMEAAGRLLPANPHAFYKAQWEGWGAVTGSGRSRIAAGQAPSYEEFKNLVREHNIRGQRHYSQIKQALMEETGLKLPANPKECYKRLWEGWDVLTGSERKYFKREDYPSLEEFEELMTQNDVRSGADYQKKRKAMAAGGRRPLPSSPRSFYGKPWPGWRAFIRSRGAAPGKESAGGQAL